ncbi:cohesin domain-containing protein [Paenibacillus guangzhouensis]|uniref:cohesin domain-containing protein n=1 Tax=Paenibacillus guangzhouensis TaxID=1473112 RepID=UPI0012669BAD|nr:cohesin domain-containing protein [Paenibacillus guangzhouensis]
MIKNVGTIVDALAQANLADDTLIVLLPDHGGGTENANGTLDSSTSHGQDSPLATTIFFAAKGKTVANNGNQEKVIQGGATKDLAQTVLSALGVQTTIGDSNVIPKMFVEQKDQNRANVGTLKLTKVTAKGTGEMKGYELSVSGLPVEAQAADIVLRTDQLTVSTVQPLQPGVRVLRSDSSNGAIHIVLTASQGIQADKPLVKLIVEGASAASSAALSQAVIADAQGRETLPNFATGAKEDDGTPPVTGLATSLSGAVTIQSGAEYKLTFCLQNVTNSVYAQDIAVQYDPAAFDFVSALPAKDTLSIVEKKNDGAGHLRLIVASQGATNGVSGTQPVIQLVFKAKDTTVTKQVTFTVQQATLANEEGMELSAAASTLLAQVIPQIVGKPGDMNNDGKYSIGDLAIIAANYGKTSASPDWSKIAIGDIDHNNVIDIDDLAWVANKILN